MSILEHTDSPAAAPPAGSPGQTRPADPAATGDAGHATFGRATGTGHRPDRSASDVTASDRTMVPRRRRAAHPSFPRIIDTSGRMPSRGMRIRRVRLLSVAKLSAVFCLLGFGVVLATLVALWNVAQRLGYVADLEEMVITALGLDTFTISGEALFDVAVTVVGGLAVFGWVMTILLAGVYNATCAVLGGLAVETGPIRRPRRVYSLRRRRFVTVQF